MLMGILLCRKKKKVDQKIEKLNQLILVKEKVDVFDIKRKLKLMKNDIRSINIYQCESNRDRFESVDILLLREDLQISDFPRLQSVTIDFADRKGEQESPNLAQKNNIIQNKQNNMHQIQGVKMVKSQFDHHKKQKQNEFLHLQDNSSSKYGGENDYQQGKEEFSFKSLDDKLYEKALKTIEKDVRTHLLLRYTIHPEQIVINQMAFKDKRAFLYVMRKMKQQNCTLRRIVFKDIITLKKNIFLMICQQMREIQNLEEIQIINTNIMAQQVSQLQHLLCWMQKQIKVLIISGANLIDDHIDILFFQKFRVFDFYLLERLELKNCPQLWKSDKYILLMKQYSQIKLLQNTSSHHPIKKEIEDKQQADKDDSQQRYSQTLNNQIALTNVDNELKENQIVQKQDSLISVNHLVLKRKNMFTNYEIKEGNSDVVKAETNLNTRDYMIQTANNVPDTREMELNIFQRNDYNNNNNNEPQNQFDKLEKQKIIQSKLEKNILQNDQNQNKLNSQKISYEQNKQEKKELISEIDSDEDQRILLKQDQRYDNRNERHFLIGQFLWQSEMQQSIDNNDYEAMQSNKAQQQLSLGISNTTQAEKNISQQDNQFFTQFFKSCIRELMDIDMCKVIDFSGLCYQNFSFDQKKQICQYIVESNTIQVFVLQYDRLFFKELCEQISAKYKAKRLVLFTQYRNELVQHLKDNNHDEFNHMIQNPNIFFSNNFKTNLFSLESIKIIASKFDQFQFDSFCYFSFLSLFILSLEIDFQRQIIEEQIVFPSHQQILEYMKKMINVNLSKDLDNSSDEEQEVVNEYQSGLNESSSDIKASQSPHENQIDENDINQSKLYNKKNQQVYNNNAIDQNHQNTSQQNSYSQSALIFETIKQYQQVFDLSMAVQDLTLKNFIWQNVQNSSKDKSFSQFLFTYFSLTVESIINLDFDNVCVSHSCLTLLQEIIGKVVSKQKTYKQNSDSDIQSSYLNYRETMEIHKFLKKHETRKNSQIIRTTMNKSNFLKTIFRSSRQLNLIKTQKSIYTNTQKDKSSFIKQDKQINQFKTSFGNKSYLTSSGVNIVNGMNQAQIQKSVLELNRNKTKSKYFLNRFRIKFMEKKIFFVKDILASFGQVCKKVEIMNASCINFQEIKQFQPGFHFEKNQMNKNIGQSQMIQGVYELPNLLLRKAKLGLGRQSSSLAFGNGNQSLFSSNSALPLRENDNFKISQLSKSKHNFQSYDDQKEKIVLNQLNFIDYLGFSYVNIVEINNQIEDLSELILIRCNLSLIIFRQIVQKLNRFKSLKKLVVIGNDFSSLSQQQENQYSKEYGNQMSIIHKSTNLTKDWNSKNNQTKRYSFLPQKSSSIIQQKSMSNVRLSFQIPNYLIDLNPNLMDSNTIPSINESDMAKEHEDCFKYCIEKIFKIQTLKYLDISNNEITNNQGLIILDELVERSLKLQDYKQQQFQSSRNSLTSQSVFRNKQINGTTISFNSTKQLQLGINSQNPSQKIIPQSKGRKSGFYSKFIEKQLNSNIDVKNGVGSSKKNSLRHFNTNFFVEKDENQEEKVDQSIENEDLKEVDKESNSFYSKSSNTERNSKNQSVDNDRKQIIKDGVEVIADDDEQEDKREVSKIIMSPSTQKDFDENDDLQMNDKYLQTEDGFLDNDNYENDIVDKKEQNSNQLNRIQNKIDPPLFNNKQYFSRQNIVNKLEDIPENEMDRVDSKISSSIVEGQIQQQGEVKYTTTQIKHKPSIFNNMIANTQPKRIKIEDLDTPELQELYISNNHFNRQTIRDITKQIGILFNQLKVLDISTLLKDSKLTKKDRKQSILQKHNIFQHPPSYQNQKENEQEEQKNNFIKNDKKENNDLQSQCIFTNKTPLSNSIVSNNDQSSYGVNQSFSGVIQSSSGVNQSQQQQQDEVTVIQRREQFQKTLEYPNPSPEFQELTKIRLNDINLDVLYSGDGVIQNIFLLPFLCEIDLSGCIDSDQTADLLVQSANNLQVCPLRILTLNRNKVLHRQSWKNIIRCFLTQYSTLEILNISECNLNEERIKGILDSFFDLEKEISLVELNLSKNIRLAGILRTFIFVLTQIYQINLQVLNLSDCNLNDQSCEEMIQGLLYGRKKRSQIINSHLNPQDKQNQPLPSKQNTHNLWSAANHEFKDIKKQNDSTQMSFQGSPQDYHKSFSLIKLQLHENNISMKMNFLIQYCFVFQLTDEDNILFSMQFSCNNEQRKQLNNILSQLKEKKGLIYSHLYDHLLEEYNVSTQTLVLGQHLFSSKKITEDIILNCLRTFSSIKKLKLFVNNQVTSILNGISNSNKSQILDHESLTSSAISIKQKRTSFIQGKSLDTQSKIGSRKPTFNSSYAINSNFNNKIILSDKQFRAKKMTYFPRLRVEERHATCLPLRNTTKDRKTTHFQNNQNRKLSRNDFEFQQHHNRLTSDEKLKNNVIIQNLPHLLKQSGYTNSQNEQQQQQQYQQQQQQQQQQQNLNFKNQNKQEYLLTNNQVNNLHSDSKQLILENLKRGDQQSYQNQQNLKIIKNKRFSIGPSQFNIFKKDQKELTNNNEEMNYFQQNQSNYSQKNKNFGDIQGKNEETILKNDDEQTNQNTKKQNTKLLYNSITEQTLDNKQIPQTYFQNSDLLSSYRSNSNFKLQSPIIQNLDTLRINKSDECLNEDKEIYGMNQKEIPQLKRINKLIDKNFNKDYVDISPQKKKSIIKNTNLNNYDKKQITGERDNRIQNLSPNKDNIYGSKRLSISSPKNRSSILEHKSPQKKRITIIEDLNIHSTSQKEDDSYGLQIKQSSNQSKSIIKLPRKSKLQINSLEKSNVFSDSLGHVRKHSSFVLGDINGLQLNERIILTKYSDTIIHLGEIESLVLQSDEKVGIISLLEFFSIISNNLKSIDFSQIQMSHSMFVRVIFKTIEVFNEITTLSFTNLFFQQSTNTYLFTESASAIFRLFTTPSIQKLSFINCSISDDLLYFIVSQLDQSQVNQFFVKDLNLSKNKRISFSEEDYLTILENVEVLNLSDCNLNEHKFCLNTQAWSRPYIERLLELDLSYNKGLSAKFFLHLGEFISQRRILKKLNISYTAMYEEKQKQFSYGLNYKNGIRSISLSHLQIREIKFSKKEGTLMFFKSLAELPQLEVIDLSEMQISNHSELDILHNYFRYDYIGKFARVKKMYWRGCSFLFDAIPYYNFESKYSLLEQNHCSLFLLTQFDNITHLDLSGCISHKKTARKFLQELDIMRRKKLINYSITHLNISKNFISSDKIRICLCNILFLFKNLQILSINTLIRYEQNYVTNILEALDSYQYFSFVQNQNYQNTKDIGHEGQNLAEQFMRINQITRPLMTNTEDNNTNTNKNKNIDNPLSKNQLSNYNLMNTPQKVQNNGLDTLSLVELTFSDISNELVNNKENIDLLLDICIANKNFFNLKKVLVHQQYSTTTNITRLQNVYSESLLEINEKYDMAAICNELNIAVQIGFKFKESSQILFFKPLTTGMNEEKPKKNNQIAQSTFSTPQKYIDQSSLQASQQINISQTSQQTNAKSNKLQIFQFTKMRIEYVDSELEEEEENQEEVNNADQNKLLIENKQLSENKQPFSLADYPQRYIENIKHSHFNVSDKNEYLFHTFSSEQDEDQIQLWRQFQPFLKKLNNPKQNVQTHISLNYTDPNIKLISSSYNIFIDNKFHINKNINLLLTNVDSLYLGNMLYHFLVQVCSILPQNHLIDFLIQYILFISKHNISELTKKSIRLPPFMILNEEDAQKIQAAFVNIQNTPAIEQKRIQNMLVSLFKPRDKPSISNYVQSPQIKLSAIKKHSEKDDQQISVQRNKMIIQVKSFLDKKRFEYSNSQYQSNQIHQTITDSKKNTTLILQKNKDYNNKIVCNYFYKSKQECEEYEEITKLKKMPPSTLNIDNFSINGLKAVYMICYHNDYFIKSDIDFESIMFINTSLSFSLREYFYQNYASQKRFYFKAIFNKIMYAIMDIFVDIDSYFKYDESIQALDSNLEDSKKSVIFFIVMIIFFYLLVFILTPLFAFISLGPQDSDGLSYIIHATFGFYAAISSIFEILFLRKVLRLTRHLTPDINLVHQTNVIARIRDYFFEFMMNIEIFNYKDIIFFKMIFFSFLSQLDAYQDICFILVTYHKEEYVIASLATLIIIFNKSIDLIFFSHFIQKSSYSNLFFQSINRIYQLSALGYLDGLSNILDVISPHNVLRITQNFFTQTFLPKKAIGLTINKQIFYRIRIVIGCDLPQIILQLLYSLRNLEKNSFTVQLSIALNVVSIIKSMYVLLTIKQSILNQMDFDELSEQKAEFLQNQFLQYQQKEIEMFEKINYNVQQLGLNPHKESSNNDSIENKSSTNQDKKHSPHIQLNKTLFQDKNVEI